MMVNYYRSRNPATEEMWISIDPSFLKAHSLICDSTPDNDRLHESLLIADFQNIKIFFRSLELKAQESFSGHLFQKQPNLA